jgi:hypothetical protein
MMNSLSRWLRSRPRTIVNRDRGRKKIAYQLYLEALEDRTVPTAVAPPSGMVSWWAGDNTGVDLAGSNNATLYGATYDAGKVANGFKFDGTSGNLQAPTVGLPTGSADRTMELWARIDQPQASGEDFFASYGSPGSTNQVYTLGRLNNGQVFVSTWGPAIAGGQISASSGWHHIAATNVGTSFNLYLDGVNVASGTMAVATPTNSTFWMGRDTGGTNGDSRRLDGMVDEVTVYNRALSATEIQAIYNAGSDGKVKPNYVTADAPTVAEPPSAASAPVTFTILRGGDLAGQATVNWSTADGTALAGSDYVAASGQVFFNSGESQKTVSVNVIGNGIQDPANKNFKLVLSSTDITVRGGGLATILEPTSIMGTVFNDANHNGVFDTGESKIAGWTVFLDVNQNAIIDPGETTTTTDAAGNYFFDTTNAPPALIASGDVIDDVALKFEVGTGGRYLNTTARAAYVDRTTNPNTVLNFGTILQPTVGVAPAGAETLINAATTAGVQGGASVSADSAGNYVIAWGTDSGGARTIFASIFNADGTKRGADIAATSTAAAGSATQVAMAGNGQFVVSWISTQGIKAQAFTAQGALVGSTATVLAFDSKTTGSLDAVAADATGKFVVLYNVRTYSSHFGWSNTHTLMAQLYTSSGAANGKPIIVASPGLINGSQGVAMAGGGNFVVAWNDDKIYAQQYTSSGSKSGGQITVATGTVQPPGWVLGPSVAMNANGRFVVSYTQFNEYMAQIYNANGSPSGGPVTIGTSINVEGTPSQVSMDNAGNITLAWTETVQNEAPGVEDVHMRRLAAGATTPDPETIVNTTTQGTQAGPAIAATGNGSFVVIWQGYGPGDDYGVFSQRYGIPPKIGSFTASVNPVPSGTSLTLTASNIADTNPGNIITKVAIYVDSNGDGELDPTTDTLLGYATQTSPGVWKLNFTVNLVPGTYTLFAQAEDSYGVFSDPLALNLQVI